MPRRARTFAGFVGQRRVIRTLEALATATLREGGVIPHLLLIGASGLGKTALAEATARRLANCPDTDPPSNFHVVHAGPGYARSLHGVLVRARRGDVVFVDEAHRGKGEDHEMVYTAIDRMVTFALDDRARFDRARFEPIAETAFIFGTNRPGALPKALRARLTSFELERYTTSELKLIAERVASARGMKVTPQAARVVAEHADTPRAVEHLVGLTNSLHGCDVNQAHIEHVLRELGFDEHGTTSQQRALLRALALAPTNKLTATGAVTALGLDAVYVREDVEGPLQRRGFIIIASDGSRQLSPGGWTVLRTTEAETEVSHNEVEVPS